MTGAVATPVNVAALRCLACAWAYPARETRYTCPRCGPDAHLEVEYDYDVVARHWDPRRVDADASWWRFRALLPLAPGSGPPTLPGGGTPLLQVSRLRHELGMPRLYVKDEGRNPTASLKDRPSGLAVLKAQELGLHTVACASTGNAASSLAAACAASGLQAVVFVPRTIPPPKLAQLLVFGATVFAVDGSYDQAFDLCTQACEAFGWYNRNTGLNPYMVEGKKTAGLEIAQQLGWHAPDAVVVPVGDAEMLAAERLLGRLTGVFAEPSGAASLAGLLRLLAEGRLAPDEEVVLLVTGSGLKAVDFLLRELPPVAPLAPTLEAVRDALESAGQAGLLGPSC